MKELSKKNIYRHISHIDTDNRVVMARGVRQGLGGGSQSWGRVQVR